MMCAFSMTVGRSLHPPCSRDSQLDEAAERSARLVADHPQLALDDDGLRKVEALV